MRNSHNITLTNNDSLTEDEKPHGHCLVPWSVLSLGYLRGDADVDLWL